MERKEILEKRRKNFMEKPLHSQFIGKTEEVKRLELATDRIVEKRN